MELAGQWRREWAGAAEYGKVTEGGVTRKIARAMEVLHASTPDTRVRVMRAVYHSSSGPGVPAASFMLHSSRRVIPSGSRLLDSPISTKPLEISSTPYESSPEPETPNYHVTEPDDTEISGPSKWRGSNSSKSIRMPSEESSSADNASIIDVSSKAHNGLLRKSSFDSESSESITNKRHSFRASPILESPTTLSTLKYKSLLNGNNDWNNRRKSYSFEDTGPLHETITRGNDTVAMESSTDSGICKSTEIVNEADDTMNSKHMLSHKILSNESDEHTFKGWLNRKRLSSSYSVKQNTTQTFQDQVTMRSDRNESNITVQSAGRVSIALPVSEKTHDDYEHKKYSISEDRKTKRVEFCKTELHFAADTGKVNIIATDEKPPPSNDFRKRRSAFVPIREKFEKPITLFGEKINDISEFNFENLSNIVPETYENDDNTGVTKSILKNKIPKPKPYLLGENMEFGSSEKLSSFQKANKEVLSAVSIINNQLDQETKSHSQSSMKSKANRERDYTASPANSNEMPKPKTFNIRIQYEEQNSANERQTTSEVRQKLNKLQMSPIQERTRKLKDSDLTYFGIQNEKNKKGESTPKYFKDRLASQNESIDDIFHSVRLVRRVSNSVGNSEAESEDDPEYQNLPLKHNYAPVPTPRIRNKSVVLKPITEQINQFAMQESRKSRSRTQEDFAASSNRSTSEPPKINRRSFRDDNKSSKRIREHQVKEINTKSPTVRTPQTTDDRSTYINLVDSLKEKENRSNQSYDRKKMELKIKPNVFSNDQNAFEKNNTNDNRTKNNYFDRTENRKHRTKVLCTPDDPSDKWRSSSRKDVQKTHNSLEARQTYSKNSSEKHRSKSSQRNRIIETPEKHCDDQKGTSRSQNFKHSLESSNGNNSIGSHCRSHNKPLKGNETTQSQSLRKLPNQGNTMKVNEKYGDTTKEKTKVDRKDSHSNVTRPKKSEYIINYDDKNGTVSSICKVKLATSGSNSKKTKDIAKETKHKKSHKVLQFPDQQWDSNGITFENARRNKMFGQRTCQLL